jgi:dihydrolipoamide dehydrogenase
MKHLRELRDWFVARVMNSVNRIGDKNIQGRARFVEPNVLEVNGERIHAKKNYYCHRFTPSGASSLA